ncbi:carotenoid oxygenase [Peziza echinospora]|nr:carotenoid oxygenase [Peziza echinospora]
MSTTPRSEKASIQHGDTKEIANTLSKSLSTKRKRRSFFGGVSEQLAPTSDWPNAIGFDYHKDVTTPVKLNVVGDIPDYVRGVLYRIGPGGHTLNTENGGTFSVDHWFDGFTQIHRFNIVDSNTVYYNSRHTCDSLLEDYRRQGSIGSRFSFAQGRDPCKSIFSKFMSAFKPAPNLVEDPIENRSRVNIGVTVSTNYPGLPSTTSEPDVAGIESLYAKSDNSTFQAIHPETLEPIGIAQQTKLHPDLKGPMSAAHAKSDPITGDVFNFNLEFGKHPTYRVFQVSKATGKTRILATIDDATPAYLHSFFLTKRFVVLCIWNSGFMYNGMGIMWHRNILDSLDDWDASKRTKFYVIDRREDGPGGGGEDKRVNLTLEVCCFDNIDIIKRFYFKNLLGNPPSNAQDVPGFGRAVMRRFDTRKTSTLSLPPPTPANSVFTLPIHLSFELPTINPRFICRKNRYTYGLNTLGKSTLMETIMKYDSTTATALTWSVQGHTPGEAIFIPKRGVERSSSTSEAEEEDDEDDGVILSVVLDGINSRSYLLCLDAKTLKETGRAEMESVVAFGFHGKYVGVGSGILELDI